MTAFQSDEFKRQRNVSIKQGPIKTSTLAVLSVICSLLFFVPLLPVIGVLLGMLAIRLIKSSTGTKGLRLAYSAVGLGMVFFVVQLLAGYQTWQAAQAIDKAPGEALTLGFAGNTGAFRNAFHGHGAGAKDSEITVFLEEVRRRYGGLLEVRLDDSAQGGPPPMKGRGIFPYSAHFTDGTVRAEVEIVFMDPWFVNKLDRIVIVDDERGNLVFPGDVELAGGLVQVPSSE